MEDLSLVVYFGGRNGVLIAEDELDVEDAVFVGGGFRAEDVGFPREKVVGVKDEQVVVESFIGGVAGLLHESLLVHHFE